MLARAPVLTSSAGFGKSGCAEVNANSGIAARTSGASTRGRVRASFCCMRAV